MGRDSKYPIIQHNGQRIYHPSPTSTPPPRGSEVFVGHIPKDVYEDELIPLFSKVGPIYKFRLMIDFCGQTRGFGFVGYFTAEDAEKAVRIFDKQLIWSKTCSSIITVHVSLDNCRLFFGNIPLEKKPEEIRESLENVIDGIVDVIVHQGKTCPIFNRGFAFVEFESHATAAIAKRKLQAGVITLWGNTRKILVNWTLPEPIVNPRILGQVKNLYFKNLPISWSRYRFKKFLRSFIAHTPAQKNHKRDNYAFVHFFERRQAERVKKIFESVAPFLAFPGEKPIEVEWARPAEYSRRIRESQIPDNYCQSVPPNIRRLVRSVPKNSDHEFSSSASSRSTSPRSDQMALISGPDISTTEKLLADRFGQLSLGSKF